jgi:hypothetical protein
VLEFVCFVSVRVIGCIGVLGLSEFMFVRFVSVVCVST